MKNLSKTFRYVNENGDEIIFDYANGFLINKPTGIDVLSVALNEASGINQTGSTIQSVNVKSRPVTVSGVLCGDDQTANKDRLLSVVRPDIRGRFYADDFYLEVRPTTTPVVGAETSFAHFQFSILAAYPYWQKDDTAGATLSGVIPKFKFPWNISQEYTFGEVVTAQFIEINNRGQVPIPYTVTFIASAEVVNPKLIDAATNNYLLINKTLAAGERLVVEITHERTYVTSSEDGECRGALDLGSKFYRLGVGWNTIKPDALSGRDNLSVDIDYSIEIVGVTV